MNTNTNYLSINEKLLRARCLLILKEALETCNYTKAAEKLGMKQPNVSAAMRYLEESMGIKLFSPAAHGVIPTEEAFELGKKALELDATLHHVHNYSLDAHKYSGVIRIWMTDGLGSFCLSRHLNEFCQKFPDVTLEITCSNETPNIAIRQADIAIVYKPPLNSDAVVISKHDVVFGLFAANSYIARYGKPKSLKDLEENHYICDRKEYNTEWAEWGKILKNSKHLVAHSNSTNMLIQLNMLGLGIGLQPINSGSVTKDLVRVLPAFKLSHPYWLVSHKDTKDSPKIREMLNFLTKVMDEL